MKTKILLLALIFTLVAINGAWAYQIDAVNTLKMKEVVYGSSIDTKVAFYQKRVYLIDSEFKVLEDIGQQAATKIDYLMTHRRELIQKMVETKVAMEQAALAEFLGKQLYAAGLSEEIYSADR